MNLVELIFVCIAKTCSESSQGHEDTLQDWLQEQFHRTKSGNNCMYANGPWPMEPFKWNGANSHSTIL